MADVSNNPKAVACPTDGGLFVKAGRVVDECGNWLGMPFPQGPKGDTGDRGDQGIQGPQGIRGPAPEHQWSGTNLRVKDPNGTWGPFVDLGAGVRNLEIRTHNMTYTWSGTLTYDLRNYGMDGNTFNDGALFIYSNGTRQGWRYGWWWNQTDNYFTSSWNDNLKRLTVNFYNTGGGYGWNQTQYYTLLVMLWKDPNR